MNDMIHEECGVFGAVTNSDEAAGITYNALIALQHRGQEGAGIAVLRNGSLLYHKDVGPVSYTHLDVYKRQSWSRRFFRRRVF